MKQDGKEILRNQAEEIRRRMGYDSYSPIDFSNLSVLLPEVTIVEYPFSKNLRGAILKISSDVAIIALNSHSELHRFYFSFCHELYHYFYGGISSRACPIEDYVGKDLEERAADLFAEYFIFPRNGFIDFFKNRCDSKVDVDTILRIGNFFHVNYGLVIKAMKEEQILTEKEADDYLKITSINVILRKRGLSDELYLIRRNDDEMHVYGKYIDLAYKLFEQDRISESKLEELLQDVNQKAIVD